MNEFQFFYVFGHAIRYFFSKLKLVPEDAPRREE